MALGALMVGAGVLTASELWLSAATLGGVGADELGVDGHRMAVGFSPLALVGVWHNRNVDSGRSMRA